VAKNGDSQVAIDMRRPPSRKRSPVYLITLNQAYNETAHHGCDNLIGGSVIMVNYREILRLQSLGYSQRQIASSVRSSRDTVSQVCRLATIHGLEWPLPDEMTNWSAMGSPDTVKHS
jgi:hypothetical protein